MARWGSGRGGRQQHSWQAAAWAIFRARKDPAARAQHKRKCWHAALLHQGHQSSADMTCAHSPQHTLAAAAAIRKGVEEGYPALHTEGAQATGCSKLQVSRLAHGMS